MPIPGILQPLEPLNWDKFRRARDDQAGVMTSFFADFNSKTYDIFATLRRCFLIVALKMHFVFHF